MAEQWITKSKKVNDETDWLLDEVNTTSYTVKRKDKATGKTFTKVVECRNYPFVSLRRDFIAKFFPKLINQSVKKETWKEILNKKYGRQGLCVPCKQFFVVGLVSHRFLVFVASGLSYGLPTANARAKDRPKNPRFQKAYTITFSPTVYNENAEMSRKV